MARLVLNPVLTAFDNNGEIEPGAKLFAYATGTSTKITIYDAENEGSTLTNPVIADAYGRFAPAFVAESRYKIVLKAADDTTLLTVDPVTTTAGITEVSDDTTPQLGGPLDTNSKAVYWSKGADVASASELLVLTDGNYFDVTGTTTITSIETTADAFGIGSVIRLHFDGALTLTHHSTDLVLPGGANITTAAGDEFEFTKYAAGDWRCTGYALASGEAVVGSGGRELLTATRTYYVRADGSDSNDGLTNNSGGAFLTIQKAINVASALDNNGNNVTIQLGSGTYTENLTLKSFLGSGRIIILGDTTTPSNVTLAGGGTAGITGSSVIGTYDLRGFTITGTNVSISLTDAFLYFRSLVFAGTGAAHIYLLAGAFIIAEGNYEITGSATRHLWAANSAYVQIVSKTITLTGTPAFSGNFITSSALSSVLINGNTFSGSATGTRYAVTLNGVINTGGGGASYFPGDSAGAASTGGQYA